MRTLLRRAGWNTGAPRRCRWIDFVEADGMGLNGATTEQRDATIASLDAHLSSTSPELIVSYG